MVIMVECIRWLVLWCFFVGCVVFYLFMLWVVIMINFFFLWFMKGDVVSFYFVCNCNVSFEVVDVFCILFGIDIDKFIW